ncbi:hypothetical protein L1887_34674 [Cichorium endivia]|nr:hypothetical protein L1887_34674 [Cichorium endivia]
MATGQLFSRTIEALFYNYKQLQIQRMLDFDFLCGRETPLVAGIINPGATPSVAGIINPGVSVAKKKLSFQFIPRNGTRNIDDHWKNTKNLHPIFEFKKQQYKFWEINPETPYKWASKFVADPFLLLMSLFGMNICWDFKACYF